MFRFLELELHGWDFWPSLRVPLDADIVVLSGPNGSGKTTLLDAVRQILNAPRLSHGRRLAHYLRRPNQPVLLRAVVSNRPDEKGRRPFDRNRVFSDEATLACALVPDGGSPEKRYAVLPGRVPPQELQGRLLEGRDWLKPEEYRRVLDYAGVSRSLMHILAIEQGRADELSRQDPRKLFRWVMEARGSQQVLDRYNGARRRYEDSAREVDRQRLQLSSRQGDLAALERKVRRLDEYVEKRTRVEDAERLVTAARLQTLLVELRSVDGKIPGLRTMLANLATTVDRLTREIGDEEGDLGRIREGTRVRKLRAEEATAACDDAVGRHAVLKNEVESLRVKAKELETLPAEDVEALKASLGRVREEAFSAASRYDGLLRDLRDVEDRLVDLERGVPRFPAEVERMIKALAAAGIEAVLAAPRVEVTEELWAPAIESALGPLRLAICVRREDERRAAELAREHGFSGPIVCETTGEARTEGPLRIESGSPSWLVPWARSLTLAREDHPPEGDLVLLPDGMRRDRHGVWVSRAADRVLGGSAVRDQLAAARSECGRLRDELGRAASGKEDASARVQELDERLTTQQRRVEWAAAVASLPEVEGRLADALEEVSRQKNDREEALADWQEAERTADSAGHSLTRRRDDLAAREKELEGTRAALGENERRRAGIEPEIEALSRELDPVLVSRAGAGELSTPEMAERDLRQARESLARFEAEGPIPEESVRDERKVLLRNVEELESHVRDRQEEADSAALELSRCRADYLEVVRSTLHDYARRARALAEMAAARLEVELPRLENDERSIDEAGIVVRIGFDGKPPVEISDTSHSGGQQVVTGLILLMAMAETEGESCFIIDEPFAHLSLDRVDDVGKFLRRSGSQFLITVPTTLDRGQLDPASLLIVLKKKASGEPFAPRPLVARE
ncbi:MAG TPA: AAA family ATPase [Candidatus Deferrimicrobiaceae bacterium]|nr:AAA family ATPase [Candidatus Deferrimicrobiaceae bacterium]